MRLPDTELGGLKLKGKEKTKETISWQLLARWYDFEWQPSLLPNLNK